MVASTDHLHKRQSPGRPCRPGRPDLGAHFRGVSEDVPL
jgi:hypothetical protein